MRPRDLMDKRKLGIILLIGLIFGGVFLAEVGVPYAGGWEVGTGFYGCQYNGRVIDAGMSSFEGAIDNSYLGSTGGIIKLNDPSDAEQQMAVYDTNPELFGSTKAKIDVNMPRTMTRDAYGETWYQTEDNVPYRTVTQTVGGITYMYDHYVYNFEVDLTTMGKAELVQGGVYGTCEGLPSFDSTDHELDLRVWTRFQLKPWDIFDGKIVYWEDSNYTLQDTFYGIMSASVVAVETGKVNPNQAHTLGGTYNAHKDHSGAALNMALTTDGVDGAPLTNHVIVETDNTTITEAPRTIPTDVLIETSASLEAGLLIDYGVLPNTWDDWTVVNVHVKYTVRVDVLYSAGFFLNTGEQDEGGEKANDTGDDEVPDAWEYLGQITSGFLMGLTDWFAYAWEESPFMVLAIIGIVVLGLYVVLKVVGVLGQQNRGRRT